MPVKSKANEITLERTYDAPLSAVWDAWTIPEQVAQWWGPRGFTITTHSRDFKTGGHWDYTMHGPDGVDYINKTKYLEIDHHKKIVYDHGATDVTKPLFRVTVLFSETKGKTHMQMTMALESPEAAEQTRKFIKAAGGNATWDRLAEYLTKTHADKEIFVINRTFNCSQEKMFELWTKPEHVSKWMPPTGFDMRYIECNIAPGGSSFYCMSGNSITMYGLAHYIEVRKPDRIVYTQQFCDADKNVTRHPAAPTWPETMRTTVEFAAEAPDQTRVTITWEVVGDCTAEEMETFIKGRSGMTIGWTGSFDKLDDYLGTLS